MSIFITFTVCLLASTIGAICGIGGGVIIKPVLDATGLYQVSTVSFLSGCTVLAMSGYSVCRNIGSSEQRIDWQRTSFLGIGAALGGLIGKGCFTQINAWFGCADLVGAIQAATLFLVTLGTFFYTLHKSHIRTLNLHHQASCVLIGLFLGTMSSFLGIGGGPINLVVLFFFFSMETKTAAQNSLYIVLLSQISSLILTLFTGVPSFPGPVLIGMVCLGILGGVLGRKVNQKINAFLVDRLFLGVMALILLICIYNFIKFMASYLT